MKKVREFFNKNNIIKTFLNGLDKRDERVFLTDIKASGFVAGDRVIRINSKDRALYFVVAGSFFAIDDSYPNKGPTYKAGAVLGIDQFLKDDYWNIDLICSEDGIIGRYEYDSFDAIKYNNAATASKIYNRVIRFKCYQMLYNYKNNKEYFSDRINNKATKMGLEDEDYFIDLQLGGEKEIINLFKSAAAKKVSSLEHSNKENMTDGKAPFT